MFIKRWFSRAHGSMLAFTLAMVLAAVLVVISETGYRQATGQLTELVLMGQSRLELGRVARRMADAESSQRGYLLTGQPAYLEPYKSARAEVRLALAVLDELMAKRHDADISSQYTADLRRLHRHVDTKLSEMEEVLALHEAGRKSAAHELMLSGFGQDEMLAIRTLTEQMLARENARVAAGRRLVFDSLWLDRASVAGVSGVSLLLIGLVLRQRRQADAQRLAQQQAIRAERDRLEMEVQNRTTELTSLARHLETAREDERARLARDLHDELGALLTAAKLDVARLRPGLMKSAPDLLPRVAHLVDTLNSGIALKRRIIEDLRPSSLDNLGLLPALEILCSEFAERAQVRVQTNLSPVAMSDAAELTAFRMVQESLNNIAKHAQARQVNVLLAEQDGMANVSVSDDGVGFDPGHMNVGSQGLVGMRYRVQAEGGRLLISAAPGQGAQVQALLPLLPLGPLGPLGPVAPVAPVPVAAVQPAQPAPAHTTAQG